MFKTRATTIAGLLLAFANVGCSNPNFVVEPKLAKSPSLEVDGPLGFAGCSEQSSGINAGEPVAFSVGPLRGYVNAAHRSHSVVKLAGADVRADFDKFFAEAPDGDTIIATGLDWNELGLRAKVDARVAGSVIGKVLDVVGALNFVLNLPLTTTETTVFTYYAEVEDRMTFSSCVATNRAATFGFFDEPRFRMTCKMLSLADTSKRTLVLNGYGNWADYRFTGTLKEKAKPTLYVDSQSMMMLGVGAVRGFDIRDFGDAGPQRAAISFWQKPIGQAVHGGTQKYGPEAWLLKTEPTAKSDALLAVLGLGYVYPWPTGCDAKRIRKEGMKQAQ